MIERPEFERLVKDVLTNLYDYAALETHPLASLLPLLTDQQLSRGEQLRQLVLETIDKLQPPDRIPATTSIEWRPYFILKGRYVEGQSLEEIQGLLSLSERQLRREHSRALQAMASLLWDQASLGEKRAEKKGARARDNRREIFSTYKITLEPLEPVEVMNGVIDIFHRRLQSAEVELALDLPSGLPPILADRVILRQILVGLFSCILHEQAGQVIQVGAQQDKQQVFLWLQTEVENGDTLVGDEEKEAFLEFARDWSCRLNATLQEDIPPRLQPGLARLTLSLPRAGQGVILVVDDQEVAIRMFRRYLSRTRFKIIGVTRPGQVLEMARQLQPLAITLDVMMPTTDGWEILQALQADPDTGHIPVIVCSVWDEPELAFSLGAADFLKKPITQKDLLQALTRLQLAE
jgi:CheY-like chemotaxis protein